ncbi:polysaccharide biosynthesis/export family protein [Faecalibacter sp. LW9]|uniref:polysaccharide biosynthesis/export family protein n=1 Tax=Faecalibacter sp. LW9 TaxID=3103144 RepID=UPI002AFF1DCF|nr:polysaccharide biosynthesis/export family protein [Faecalibacter sp. LW9]
MKNYFTNSILITLLLLITSCISLKDIQLIQPDENLKLNSKGMIEYNVPEYYIQQNDLILINVSSVNPSTLGILSDFTTSGNRTFSTGQNQGVLVRKDGSIELPRIGKINVEGLTIEQARKAIQDEFYKIYTPDGTYIDVNLSGIEYTLIGEASNGVFRANKRDLTIIEALARSGNNNIYANFKKVRIIRTTPDGTKQVYVDLTKESIMNSEYYWIQNNDIIVVNPRKEKVWGVGLNPLSVVTTTMGVIGTILGVYLFFDRF